MPIDLRRWPTLALAAAALFLCTPAFAQIFVPPPARWVQKPAPEAIPVAPYGLEAVPAAKPTPAPFLPVGVSFAFADNHEHIELDPQLVGTTDASVYLGGADAYVGCSLKWPLAVEFPPSDDAIATIALNVGALGGYADGRSTVLGTRLDLHGPTAGVSSTVLVHGPLWPFFPRVRTTPFAMGGVQYLATNYSKIDGWVHAYSVRPRTGLLFKSDGDRQLFVYGGAAYEHFSEEQTLSDLNVTTHSRPRRPWAGLVGTSYVHPLDDLPIKDVSLTVEGEVGDRSSVLLSLRFGFGVPL